MDFYEFIKNNWVILSALVLFIVWLIRLEGRHNLHGSLIQINDASIKDLKFKHESLDSKVVDKLSSIEKALARVEGFLSRKD